MIVQATPHATQKSRCDTSDAERDGGWFSDRLFIFLRLRVGCSVIEVLLREGNGSALCAYFARLNDEGEERPASLLITARSRCEPDAIYAKIVSKVKVLRRRPTGEAGIGATVMCSPGRVSSQVWPGFFLARLRLTRSAFLACSLSGSESNTNDSEFRCILRTRINNAV